MECSCCNKKRKLLESFAVLNIDNQKFELCSECNNLVFKLRDFSVKKNKKEFDIAQKKILKKCKTNNNPTFSHASLGVVHLYRKRRRETCQKVCVMTN